MRIYSNILTMQIHNSSRTRFWKQRWKTVYICSSYTVSFIHQVLACTKREYWFTMGDKVTLYTKIFSIISNALIVCSLFHGQPTPTALSPKAELCSSPLFFWPWSMETRINHGSLVRYWTVEEGRPYELEPNPPLELSCKSFLWRSGHGQISWMATDSDPYLVCANNVVSSRPSPNYRTHPLISPLPSGKCRYCPPSTS